MSKLQVAFAMRSNRLLSALMTDFQRGRLARFADVIDEEVMSDFSTPHARAVLRQIDVLITGWGCRTIDQEILDRAPNLRLIAHAAGSVKGHVSRVAWERGIHVTTSAQADGIPVSEYTLAMILLAGKGVFPMASQFREERVRINEEDRPSEIGNSGNTVGIVGASRIGRMVLDLLHPFRFRVLIASPELSVAEARDLGGTLTSLDSLMAESDVVSLHVPVLPTTIGMIGAVQLAEMKDGATLINTARGAIVNYEALRQELLSGRLNAVLDVTTPEPLAADDPLYDLDNVLITPHIAGAVGNELHLMGEFAVSEVVRLAQGKPLAYPVNLWDLDWMA